MGCSLGILVVFLKHKRTWRTAGRVLPGPSAFGAVGFSLRNLAGRGWAGMVSRKASGIRARIKSSGNGVPFGNYVCAFRGVGGERAGSYLGFIVLAWPPGKQHVLWTGVCSTRRSGAVRDVGCDRRNVSRQRVCSNLGFMFVLCSPGQKSVCDEIWNPECSLGLFVVF